jgi:hypothetical protein
MFQYLQLVLDLFPGFAFLGIAAEFLVLVPGTDLIIDDLHTTRCVNACVHAHTSLCISAFTHTFMHSHAIHLS